MLSADGTVRAHDPITTQVTFDREIRAILASRCASCHIAGGSAPMPLTTYEEVRPWARAMKEQVLSRRMPKWHAARGFGAFLNDPSLTPLELGLIAAWVDGGLPKGSGAPSAPPARVAAARDDGDVLVVPAQASRETFDIREAQWITGWRFEPGDPLIASATFSVNARSIGTWVAGDRPVVFPAGAAMRVAGQVQVDLQRRPAADFERLFTPRSSVLRLTVASADPERRVWTERAACGAPRTRGGTLLAVRPILPSGASARVWLQRPGAPVTIVGWFRNVDARYLRSYWLARPIDLSPDVRVQADVPCEIQLTLAAYF